jgi:CRISPR/Cas system-associated exonuclease Cas4 (RecB family)
MQPFLDKIAEEIVKNHKDNLDQLCIVFPNRRAGLFFKKYIAQKIDKPLFMPAIYSVEDFIMELSGYQLIDQVSQLFELYRVHLGIEEENAQTFDEFVNWGRVLLKDFNEIDQYLVNAKYLFGYLSEAKALSVWNLNNTPLTAFEKKYLRFYTSLGSYYDRFTAEIQKKKVAYPGLASRKVYNDILEANLVLPWKRIIFAGLNALTEAEEKIIEQLVMDDKAEIFWDADKYYLEDSVQEAGIFLRSYRKNRHFGDFRWSEDHFKTDQKEINIIGVSSNVGQAKFGGELLLEIAKNNKNLEDTAVVLAEENLLMTVLNSLPGSIGDYNVTMGLPIKYTPVYNLISSIFVLHENVSGFSKAKGGDQYKYYNRDVFKILDHPYIKYVFTAHDLFEKRVRLLQSANKVFISKEDIDKLTEDIIDSDTQTVTGVIFNDWDENPEIALTGLIQLIEVLRDKLISVEKNDQYKKVELEYLYFFSKIIKQIRTLSETYPYIKDLRTLKNIYNQVTDAVTIPFYGEPLKGLQVMGMLETRTLDFKNLIMLSVNEDVLPAAKTTYSFIPFDIRREFKLPTYKDRNAVYAYHFYRLMQRSEHIHLLYNTEGSDLGGGDKSRYISQIVQELVSYNPKITIKEDLLNIPSLRENERQPILIEKDHTIAMLLLEKAERGLAPSSIGKYINCQLQFYYSEIAGLKEMNEVEETIDAATMGSIIHKVLYSLYEPYQNNIITKEIISKMSATVDNLTELTFRENYSEGELKYGKNMLIVDIAKLFIKKYLVHEKKKFEKSNFSKNQLIPLYLEKEFHHFIKLNFLDEKISVKIKGSIDRVDKCGDNVVIIDYKTGNVNQNELNVKELEALIIEPKWRKSFQLMLYAWIYLKSHNDPKMKVEAGIISFRKPSGGLYKLNLPGGSEIDLDGLEEFTELIEQVAGEIYDLSKPFEQTMDTDNCTYCPFVGICNR